MAQTLKPELRARVLSAAEELFADAGYRGATMAAIAERAGMSTGNLYRYFSDKDALFYEVVSHEFAARFMRLLARRMKSLVQASDVTRLESEAQRDAEALLSFWVEHRLKVVIILDRAQGSRHEAFAEQFIEALMKPTVSKLAAGNASGQASPTVRFLLGNLFRNTVRMIVAILEAHLDEAQIRHAFSGFWSYQLAGMAGFEKWVSHA
jgi:AcrR family transcriptional regulator